MEPPPLARAFAMRATVLAVTLVLLAAPALAMHNDGKGARSLGGETVPRTDTWILLEADEFPDKPLGHLEDDPEATGGKAWNLTTYGFITTEIDVPADGVVWVDIRARGWHPEGMMNPHMHILIDGEQRAEWDVRGEWLAYPQTIPLLKGKHTLSVDNFDNYRGADKDRILEVDWVQISTPTLEGSPVIPAGGYAVIDAEEIHNSVTGTLQREPTARNETQWLQWGVGCFFEMIVAQGAGDHELDARLRGNVHEGVGTRVQVRVDGTQIEEYHVGDDWEERTTRFTVDAGPHTVEICYDNDEPGKKRNLWLDEFTITSFATGTTQPPTTPSTPPPPREWPALPWTSAHGGLANHRHTESAIDRESILTAQKAWSWRGGAVTGTPAFEDGILYFADFAGKLTALKAEDGSVVWSVDLGAGVDSSVALAGEHVYVGDMDGWLHARKRSDGAEAWRVRADEVEGTHLYGSPKVHDGVLYTGVASEQTLIEYEGEQTFRGSVAAFDADDGRMLWKTYTQEAPGLGVSVWSTPAIDPDAGLLFVGTGNSYGEPVSQYTDSILALKMSDGSIVWHFQATKNDAFNARGAGGPDRDFGASPILFEADGRKLVGDGDKGGRFYALDRATGELVWNATAAFKVEGVPSSQVEGFLGTAAYGDGTIFAPTTARSMVTAIDATTGAVKWATELNPLPRTYGERMFAPATYADGVVLQGNAYKSVFALDAANGDVLANLTVEGAVQGGVTIAGAMFFVPDVGKDLWSGKGGVTAFRVEPGEPPVLTPPTQDPAVGGTPSTPPTSGGPSDTPTENIRPGGEIGGGIPGAGAALVLCAVAAVAVLARRRPR